MTRSTLPIDESLILPSGAAETLRWKIAPAMIRHLRAPDTDRPDEGMLQAPGTYPLRLYVDPRLLSRCRELLASDPAGSHHLGAVLDRHGDQLELRSTSEISAVLDTFRGWAEGRQMSPDEPGLSEVVQRLTTVLTSELSRTSRPRAWFPVMDTGEEAPSVPSSIPPATQPPAHPVDRRRGHSPAIGQRFTPIRGQPEPEPRRAGEREQPRTAALDPHRHREEENRQESRTSPIFLLARLGRDLGLGVGMDQQASPVEGSVPLPRSLQELDVVWMRDGEPMAAFCCRTSPSPDLALLRLSDVRISTSGAVRLYVAGEPADRAQLSAALARPSFKLLKLNTGLKLLRIRELEDRLRDLEGLTPYLRHEFIDLFAEPI